MKITFVLTDDSGKEYRGAAEMTPLAAGKQSQPRVGKPPRIQPLSLSFDGNPRAFMKKHGRNLSGPQKFTLLLAWLAKGKISQPIPLGNLEKQWNSMKALTDGPFNRAHSVRAKDNGWANSPRRGFYVLTASWKEALGGGSA